MEIQIKELLLEGRILDHVKRNWGKYGAGATAAGLGTVYAAGQGILGVDAQDTVQDFGGEVSQDLENSAIIDQGYNSRDALIKTFSRPDNLVSNWDENKETLDNQKNIQSEEYTSQIKNTLADGIRKITNMDGEPDQTNFMVRNPGLAAKLQMDRGLAYVKPYFNK